MWMKWFKLQHFWKCKIEALARLIETLGKKYYESCLFNIIIPKKKKKKKVAIKSYRVSAAIRMT